MTRSIFCIPLALIVAVAAWPTQGRADDPVAVKATEWTLKADIVEATSDRSLCPSHDVSAADSNKHRCKFFCAIRVIEGSYGRVDLAGLKVVLAGDIGRSLDGMELSTLVVTYAPNLSAEQKIAMADIVQQLIPLKWVKKKEVVAAIEWKSSDDGLVVSVADHGQLDFEQEKDPEGRPVAKSGLSWWTAVKTDDLRLGRATFGYKTDGMDLSYSRVGAFRTRVEAKGSMEKLPKALPSDPGDEETSGKK